MNTACSRRIFTLITAAALLLTATACGKTKTETPKGSADPAPDILQLDGSAFPIKSYNDKGILVDLRQYLDKETDIQLHPTAVRFLEQDGGLIMISPGFTVLSMVGDSDIVGEEPGWSLADIASALKRNQEIQAFPRAVTRMTFYVYAAQYDKLLRAQ